MTKIGMGEPALKFRCAIALIALFPVIPVNGMKIITEGENHCTFWGCFTQFDAWVGTLFQSWIPFRDSSLIIDFIISVIIGLVFILVFEVCYRGLVTIGDQAGGSEENLSI